jgi:hypothetical protein
MTKRSLQVLTVGVLALALLLMGAGFPTKTVTPKKWANTVCSSVGDWVKGTQTGATKLDKAIGGTGTDIPKIKKAVVGYLSATGKATDKVSDQIEHAGTPDTPKGKQASKALTSGFAKIHAALKGFTHDASKISTSNPAAAVATLTKLNSKINSEFGQAFGSLGKLDPNHKLAKAFKATKACKALN